MLGLAVLASAAVLLFGSAASGAAPSPGATPTPPGTATEADRARVDALREQADSLFADIEKATTAYEDGQRTLLEAQNAAALARSEAAARQAVLETARNDLEAFVDAAYRHPLPDGVLLLTIEAAASPEYLHTASYITAVSQMQTGVVKRVSKARTEAEKALTEAQRLEDAAAHNAAELEAQRQRLVAESDRVTTQLTRELLAMSPGGQRASSAQVWSCDGTELVGIGSWPNGLLPETALCPLPQPGFTLRGDAASAFGFMNEAFHQTFGRDLCLSDAYRNLARQQYFFATRPALAAVPGHSNHGWGLAVDLCQGEASFGTTEHQWLKDNSARWGWVHPAWAGLGGSKPEPWHWEYALG